MADCQQSIAQQKQLISELDHDHRAATEAQGFLRTFEKLLAFHIARRKHLEQELAAARLRIRFAIRERA